MTDSSPDRESAELLQLQYQASATIYGSQDPVEILEALYSFLAAGYGYAELGLVDASNPALINVLAQIDVTGAHVANLYRALSDYPASDAISAVDLLSIPNVADDKFLTAAERTRLAEQDTAALIIVPMVTAQQLTGLLVLSNSEPADPPANRLRALRSLVDQAAVVFENQRLLEAARSSNSRLESQVRLLESLNRLTTELSRYTEQQPLLDFVAQTLTETAGVDHVGIVLLDPDGQWGTVVSEFPESAALGSKLDMANNPLMTMALQTPDRPLIVDDAMHNPVLPEGTRELFTTIGIHALMVVPLVVAGETIGSLGFDLYTEGRKFSAEAVDLARIVGTQLAVNLQNIRLFNDVRRRAAQLEQIARNEALLNQIASRYQVTSTLDSLLSLTVMDLGQALGAKRGRVRLVVPESEQP